MAWELVYTSAPQGLASGSTGFCTVAASHGLPASLGPRLEALSGYRPIAPQGLPDATAHPVRFSHVRLNHAGETLAVLSRVSHAGTDYSGRTNKLADHRVLHASERAQAGPAWVSRQPGVMREAWDEAPRVLTTSTPLPSGQQEPVACDGWRSATGDAGWAGVLVDQFLLDPAAPFYVVYDPRQLDPLRLVDEAIALLPASRRWDVTYSTYHTDSLGESGVSWRFVAQETPAVEAARALQGSPRFLDTTTKCGLAPASHYVELARTGVAPEKILAAGGAGVAAESAATETATASDGVSDSSQPYRPAVATAASAAPERETRSSPPVHSTLEDPGRPGWKWVAAAVWPVVVALLAYLFWPPASPVATVDAAVPGPDTVIAGLRQRLEASERENDRLTTQLRQAESLRWSESAAEIKPKPLPQTQPHETSAGAILSPTVLESLSPIDALPDEPLATPARQEPIFASLPEAISDATGSVSVGASSRLAPRSAWLWETGSPWPQGTWLNVTAPWDDKSSDLRWHQEGDTVTLTVQTVDALGGSHETPIGRATLAPEGLRWDWIKAELPREWAGRLDELRWLAAVSSFSVSASDGTLLGAVQGLQPVLINAEPDAKPHRVEWKSEQFGSVLSAGHTPEGWTTDARPDGRKLVLHGPAGASLEIKLNDGARGQRLVSVAWSRDAESLEAAAESAHTQADALAEWTDAVDVRQAEFDAALTPLPRTEDGQINHDRRFDAAHREAFARYDRADAARSAVRQERPGLIVADAEREIGSLRKRAEALAREADEVRRFTGAKVLVVAERSQVTVARVTVSGKVAP